MTEAKKVEATGMAIRETLMEYFKGGCVDSLVEDSNIYLIETRTRQKYRWERREHEIAAPCTLLIGTLPIANVTRKPASITFIDKTLTRSKQLTAVYGEVQKFMERYLMAVEVKHA